MDNRIPSRAHGWLRGRRRPELLRYEISVSKRANPGDISLLRRAFARALANREDGMRAIDVLSPAGSFLVVMDLVGPPAQAARECESLFALAWYDAFGVRGSAHIGRLVGERRSRLLDPLAS